MFAIIGVVVVLGAVFGGYLLEGGHFGVIFQPIELLIIGGAAAGSFLIASPKAVVLDTIKHGLGVFTAKEFSKQNYLSVLMLMYELMTMARRGGVVAIEPHVGKPDKSPLFAKYPLVQKDHEVLTFVCDNLKVLLAGNIEPHHYEALMDVDISTRVHHLMIPPTATTKVADSLPGLGIVAAVLGVVLTMAKINEPPEVLGHSIGAALVGTFLGVLMCYGFVGPAATNLEHQAKQKQAVFRMLKICLANYALGLAPALAIEAARRAIPGSAQPTFEEVEGAMRGGKKQ